MCVCAEEISCSPLPCPSYFFIPSTNFSQYDQPKKPATKAFAAADPAVGSEDPLSSLQVEDEDRYRTSAVELNFVSSFLDKAAIGPFSNQYETTLLIGAVSSLSGNFDTSVRALYPIVIDHLGLEMDSGIFNAMAHNCGTEAAATSKAATATTIVKVRGDSFATQQFIMGVLPTSYTRDGLTHKKPLRNEHPMMVHTITQLVKENAQGNTRIIVLAENFPVGPLASGRYSIIYSYQTIPVSCFTVLLCCEY